MPLDDDERAELSEMIKNAMNPIMEQLTATESELQTLREQTETVNTGITGLRDETFTMFKELNLDNNDDSSNNKPPAIKTISQLIDEY